MRKALEESKRSIHSTRIDTIAGDPTPIKPVSVLPVNPISRPTVEDPEYLPDTVSELAASLSALARLVPAEQVREIYSLVRDLVDRIAPVTRTSLDYATDLSEARALSTEEKGKTFSSLEEIAESIVTSVKDKLRHFLSVGTRYGDSRVAELEKFLNSFVSISLKLKQLDKQESEGKSSSELRELILRRFFELKDEYDSEISPDLTDFDLPGRQDRPTRALKRAIDTSARLTPENKREIRDAFTHRIVELQSSGDTFDAAIAQAVEERKEKVEKIISEEGAKFSKALFDEITKDNGDLSSFKMEATSVSRRDEDQKFSVHLLPLFAPGRIKAVPAGKNPDGTAVEVPFRPESAAAAGSLSEKDDDKRKEIVLTIRRDGSVKRKITLHPGTLTIGSAKSSNIVLDDKVVDRLHAKLVVDKSGAFIEDEGGKSGTIFKGRRVTRQSLDDGDDVTIGPFTLSLRAVSPAIEDMRTIASTKYVHVYRRYLQMFDGSEVEVQPDVRIDFDLIKSDFVDNAAEDLRNQGVRDAIKVASEFYEENKLHIIRDALHPSRGAAKYQHYTPEQQAYLRSNKGASLTPAGMIKTKLRTPERAALIVANEKIDDFDDLIAGTRIVPEGEISDRARNEVMKFFDKGMSEDEIVRSVTSQGLKIKEDEIRRLARSATIHRVRQRDEAESIASDLTRKVKAAFASQTYVAPGSPSVPSGQAAKLALQLLENSKVSFEAIASGDEKTLRKRRIEGVTLVRVHTDETIKRAQADLITQTTQAKQIASELDGTAGPDSARGGTDLRLALLNALIAICDRRMRVLDAVQTEVAGDLSPAATEINNQKSNAYLELSEAAKGARSLAKDPSKASFEDIVDLYAQIVSQVADVDQEDDANSLDPKSALSQAVSQSVGAVVDAALDKYSNDPDVRAEDTLSLSGQSTDRLVSHVTRVAADLSLAFPGQRDVSELTTDAFERYGLDITKIIFVVLSGVNLTQHELNVKNKIESDYGVVTVSDGVFDELLGAKGVGKSVLEKLKGIRSESQAVDFALSAASSLFDAYFSDAASAFAEDESSSVMIVRSIVNIACIVLSDMGEKGEDQAKRTPALFESIRRMIVAGQRSPTVLASSLVDSFGRKTRRAVAVDLQEVGVGVFVDVTGSQVVRAVGLPTPNDVGHLLSFIDPTLRDEFNESHGQILREMISVTKVTQPAHRDHISREVTRSLVSVLMQSAAAVNASGRISARSRMSPVLGRSTDPGSEEFKLKFKLRLEELRNYANSRTATRYTRTAAMAALNYMVSTGKDPGKAVPYFTPVRSERREDPDTGEKLSKASYDFVYRTLQIDDTALNPTIPNMPASITERFMQSVYALVDMHVLTEINNVFGRVRTPDELTPKGKKKKKGDQVAPDASKDAVGEFLARGDVTKTMSFTSPGRVTRSPETIRNLQVLTTSSVLSETMPYSSDDGDERAKKEKSIQQIAADVAMFLVRLMISASGYIRSTILASSSDGDEPRDLRLTPDKITQALVEETTANRRHLLNEKANQIIDKVQQHVKKQIDAVVGELEEITIKDPLGNEKQIRMTRADVEARGKLIARGEIMQRVGNDFYTTLGLKSPLTIVTNPVTGRTEMPPSPKEFFEMKMRGVVSVPGQQGYDPFVYITRAAEALNAYREILKKYGMTAPTGEESRIDRFTSALKKLEETFPDIVENARQKTKSRRELRSLPEFGDVNLLNMVVVNDVPQIEGKPILTIGDTSQLIKALEDTRAQIADSIAPYEKVANEVKQQNLYARIDRSLSVLRTFQDRAERHILPGIAISSSPTDKQPTLYVGYFVELYNDCAVIVRECIDLVKSMITTIVAADIEKVYDEDIVRAILEKDRALEKERGELAEKREDTQEVTEKITKLKAIRESLLPPKDQRDAAGRVEVPKVLQLTQLSADYTKEMQDSFDKAKKQFDAARARVSDALSRATSNTDQEIESLANGAAKFISEQTGSKVSTKDLLIFDTEDNLDNFRQQLINSTIASLVSDKHSSHESIRQLANTYVDSFLSERVFGVRYPKLGT